MELHLLKKSFLIDNNIIIYFISSSMFDIVLQYFITSSIFDIVLQKSAIHTHTDR